MEMEIEMVVCLFSFSDDLYCVLEAGQMMVIVEFLSSWSFNFRVHAVLVCLDVA